MLVGQIEPDAGDLRRGSVERGASRVESRRESRSREISLDSTSAETSETSTTLDTVTPEALSASTNDTLLTTLVVQVGLDERMALAEELLRRDVDLSLQALIRDHLEQIRADAETLGRDDLASKSERLLERIRVQRE